VKHHPKIVIIGGGSYSWGLQFIRDIAITPELSGSEIVLHDLNPEPLELVFALGEKILRVVLGGAPYTGSMNLPNQGQIRNLPEGVVVDTFARADASGVNPISLGALPAGVEAVIQRHIQNQELIVGAALSGQRELALQALANDPLVMDLEDADAMLTEMLAANRSYLRFFPNAQPDSHSYA